MIYVKCPNCGKEHILDPGNIEQLLIMKILRFRNCHCGKKFFIKEEDDCYFVKVGECEDERFENIYRKHRTASIKSDLHAD